MTMAAGIQVGVGGIGDAGGPAPGAAQPGQGSANAVGAACPPVESSQAGVRPTWSSFLEAFGVVLPNFADGVADNAKAASSSSVLAALAGQENAKSAQSGQKGAPQEIVPGESKHGVEAATKTTLRATVAAAAPGRVLRGKSTPLRTADESIHPKKNRDEMVATTGSGLATGTAAAAIAAPPPAEPSTSMAAPIHSLKSARSFDSLVEPAAKPRSAGEATESLRNPGIQASAEEFASRDRDRGESTPAMESTGKNALPTTASPMVEPAGTAQFSAAEKLTASALDRDNVERSTNPDSRALRIDAHRAGENFAVTPEPGIPPTRSIENSPELNLTAAKGDPQPLVIDLDGNPPSPAAPMRSPGRGRKTNAHASAIGGAGLSRASTAGGPSSAYNAAPGERATQTAARTHSFASMRSLDSAPEPVMKPGHLKSATGSIGASQPVRAATLDPMNSGPVRDISVFAAVAKKPDESVIGAQPATAEAREHGLQDTFAALDGERAIPQAAWIHARAHHAEAGYFDPALGWVGVRADTTAGGVHAAVLPGSAEAAQVLGSHLSGLNAYLSEHHGPAATVSIAAAQERSNSLDQRNSSGQNDGARGGQNKEEPGSRERSTVSPAPRDERLTTAAANLSGGMRATGGRYISVIA